ncbi:Hypothetical predicted protein, partial [Paramuricea clavata]
MAAEMNGEIQDFQAKLRKKGWNISTEGIEECMQELGQRDRTVENATKWALNCDLKEIGFKVLTEEVKRGQVKMVEGPLVLQIQKIRNISAPKANEESGAAPRLLKLQLTDGHTTCFALEHSLIQKLSLSTPPGTKIRLKGTVPLFCGFMLLEPRHVEVLGGKVEKLILKWETHKSVSQQRALPSNPSDDGPPLFIAFDPKTSNSHVKRISISKAVNQNTQDSVSSQESSSSQKDENKKAHAAFEHSRDQRIQTAKQGNERQSNPTKTGNNANRSLQVAGNQRRRADSSSDRDQRRVEKDLDVKPTGPKQEAFGHNQSNKYVRDAQFSDKNDGQKYAEKNNHGRRSGFRKGGRHNDDSNDDYSTSRPSEGTLWDFLETKLPSKGYETENAKPKNSSVDYFEWGESNESRQPSSQRDGQYRNQRANQQQHDRPTLSTGGNLQRVGYQGIRDDHRKNQNVDHQPYQQGDQGRNNREVDNYRDKESDRSRYQPRGQQKHEHQTKDQHVHQHKKTRERPNQIQYSKEKEQGPEKKDDKHNDRRNDRPSRTERVDKQSKQPEIRHGNQSGKNDKVSGQQNNQMGDSYRKDYPKYDKADHKKSEGGDSTLKSTRVEDRTPNYRSKGHKGEKQGGVLTDQSNRGSKVEQNVRINRGGAGPDGKRSQQSREKQGEHDGRTPRGDVQQYRESRDVSNKKHENANKGAYNVSTKTKREHMNQTHQSNISVPIVEETQKRDSQIKSTPVPVGQSDSQKHRDQNERYGDGVPGGRGYESRKQ